MGIASMSQLSGWQVKTPSDGQLSPSLFPFVGLGGSVVPGHAEAPGAGVGRWLSNEN